MAPRMIEHQGAATRSSTSVKPDSSRASLRAHGKFTTGALSGDSPKRVSTALTA